MFYIIEYRWPYEHRWIIVDDAEVFGGEEYDKVFPLYSKRKADELKRIFEERSTFSQKGKPLVFRVTLVGRVK